jgi:hypothetical protein
MDIGINARGLQSLWETHHAWVIGFVLVAVISYTRFNTPPTSRPSTTWGRYHTFAAVYMILSLVLWIVLSNVPAALIWVSPQLAKGLNLGEEVTRQLTAPLYAALALTVSIPAIKPLKIMDLQLRRILQGSARIPWEAKRLSNSLLARTWLPQRTLQREIENHLKTAGFGADAISFLDDGSEAALWTKLTCLYRHLSRWKGATGFVAIRAQQARLAAFYEQYANEFEQIRIEYATLDGAAKRLFSLLDELQHSVLTRADGPTERHTCRAVSEKDLRERIRAELAESFVSRAKRLEQMICDLVSRALLKCGLTEGGRRAELGAMGFVVNVSPGRFFDEMLMLYAALATLYLSVLLYVGHPTFFFTGVTIATIYLGSILAGLYPKRWPWGQASERGLPFRAYFLSAVVAFAFSLAASFALRALLTWNVGAALRAVREQAWPWAFIGAATAVLVAYLSDRPRSWPQWAETVMQAGGTALAAAGVWMMRARICEGSENPHCLPPLLGVVGTATLAGAMIGFVVPALYRRPESLVSRYNEWMIKATAIRGASGQFDAHVTLDPPKEGTALPAGPQVLPFQETFESPDEALAQAIGHARAWIERRHPQDRPGESRARHEDGRPVATIVTTGAER